MGQELKNECTKPDCDCIDIAIRNNNGEGVKSYPCLRAVFEEGPMLKTPKPLLTNNQILASANVTDPERFRYEVESKTKYDKDYKKTRWPNEQCQANICDTYLFYYNSEGKEIASFNLKAWK